MAGPVKGAVGGHTSPDVPSSCQTGGEILALAPMGSIYLLCFDSQASGQDILQYCNIHCVIIVTYQLLHAACMHCFELEEAEQLQRGKTEVELSIHL